jgi:hypothetical protein
MPDLRSIIGDLNASRSPPMDRVFCPIGRPNTMRSLA